MKMITKLLFIIQITLLLGYSITQGQEEELDNYGKEFYAAFMPNFHNFGSDSKVYIFVSAKTATTGKIEYIGNNGLENSIDFTISEPNEVTTFSFSYSTLELEGQNNSGRQNRFGGDVEIPLQKSVRITSEEDIAVVIFSAADLTSDACLLYPVDGLGKNYFVFSYESNFYETNRTFGTTPSQFCVIATEDGTAVKIEPSVSTFRNGLEEQNIILNQGEVYLVQADILNGSTSKGASDLTGTRVTSDKKIAILGGHQRATIPYPNYGSRDFLVSQMIPLESWGRDVFVIPFEEPSGGVTSLSNDINRITVAYDDTDIYVGGELYQNMNKGEIITREITEAYYLEADKPIRASLYKKSSQSNVNQTGFSKSDPFMVLFPPRKQFLQEYNFINAELDSLGEHFASVIVPTADINSLRLDGERVVADFKPIFGINYSYAHLKVSEGGHNIYADVPFGICVYGYSFANSYGYVGGIGLRGLDWTPPEFTSEDIGCFDKSVIFTEKYIQDSGIDSVVFNELINIDYTETTLTKELYTASFSLADKYQDGVVDMYVKDREGSKEKQEFIIEGFTLTLSSSNVYEFTNLETDTVKPFRSYCQDITITNYGVTDKSIKELALSVGKDFTLPPLPNKLAPGASYTFQICYESDLEFGLFTDTLRIKNDCFEEDLGVVSYFLPEDKNPPELTQTQNVCGDGNLLASETFDTQYGFGTYEQIDVNNVKITELRNELDNIELGLELIDPLKDGTYTILFEDLVGNDTTYNGILQGFTADFVRDSEDEVVVLPTTSVGNYACQEIMIENDGLLPITLEQITLRDKYNFFIPQSQLPLVVPPDTALPLLICFYDEEPTDENVADLIQMTFNCLEKDITIEGKTEEVLIYTNSRCDYEYRIRFDKVPYVFSAEPAYPNPAQEQASMVVSVDKPRNMTIDIVNNQGDRYRYFEENMQKGDYNMDLDISNLPTGSYIIEIISEEKRITQKLLINK